MTRFRARNNLRELLGVGVGSVVAVMGAGGKHTLIYRLADELQAVRRGERSGVESGGWGVAASCSRASGAQPVIISATTNFHRPRLRAGQVLLLMKADEEARAWGERLESAIAAGSQLLIFEGELARGMLQGIDGCRLWELRQLCPDVPMVIQSDGARKRCFKAPSDDEPDVPVYDAPAPLKGFRPDLCILVFGLDSIGKRLGPDTTHRPERVTALTGLQAGERITPREVALVASHGDAYHRKLPADARKVLYLSKARSDGDLRRAAEVFEQVERARFHLLVAGDTLAGRFYAWNDECRRLVSGE